MRVLHMYCRYCLWGHYVSDLLQELGIEPAQMEIGERGTASPDLLSTPFSFSSKCCTWHAEEHVHSTELCLPCRMPSALAGSGDVGWPLGALLVKGSQAVPGAFGACSACSRRCPAPWGWRQWVKAACFATFLVAGAALVSQSSQWGPGRLRVASQQPLLKARSSSGLSNL